MAKADITEHKCFRTYDHSQIVVVEKISDLIPKQLSAMLAAIWRNFDQR